MSDTDPDAHYLTVYCEFGHEIPDLEGRYYGWRPRSKDMNGQDKVVALKHYRKTRRIMRGEEERSAPVNRRVERSALRSATEAVRPAAPWWRRAWWKLTGRA